MIPFKIKEHLDNYIHQEVYVQIAVIKGKEKISTKAAIENYFHSNHFREVLLVYLVKLCLNILYEMS